MLTISLEEMKFYSGHGVYPEEKIIGNTFIVDVSVSVEDKGPIKDISQTIDYETVYDIIRTEMNMISGILESLAYSCVEKIKQHFPQAKIISIKISKLHPPMIGEIGRSKITLSKTYE